MILMNIRIVGDDVTRTASCIEDKIKNADRVSNHSLELKLKVNRHEGGTLCFRVKCEISYRLTREKKIQICKK